MKKSNEKREISRYEIPGRSGRQKVLSYKIKEIGKNALSGDKKSASIKKKSKEKILRNYDKPYLSEPEYSTHHTAKKQIIKPSSKTFISRNKSKI